MAAADKSTTLELAEFASGVSYGDIPGNVIQRAKEALVDGLGVMLAGCRTDSADAIGRYLEDLGISGNASVIGRKEKRPAQFAALANGISGHAMDYDDTQLPSVPDRVYGLLTHPTTPVLAASLAVVEETGAGGRELLAAYCAGVEVECKIAEAINPQHYKVGFHTTGTIGIFGAAAASAKLLGLGTEKMRHAVGIAASKSAGIRASFGTMTKPYHAGAAAENGVVTAKLARAGYRTTPEALDGQWGFLQVLGGGSAPEVIHGSLGNPYSLVDPGVSIKPYPCGSLIHPSMDAFLELVVENDIRPDDIEEIRLGTSSNVLNPLRYQEPQTALEAKFSIPFCLAILVLERKAGIGEFTDEMPRRPEVRAMMKRVTPYLHEGIEAMGYERMRSLVEVKLKGSRILSRDASTSRGTPERPMSPTELEAKFRECAQGVIDDATQRQVLEMVYGLEGLGDVRELTALLRT